MDIQMRGGRADEWGMGEGVFPNMAEQPVGHGYSHPAHLDAQEIGTHTASSPAGSAALPGPGEGAAKPGTACPPARLAQKQDGHHLCTWAGSAFCLSNQPLVSNLTIGSGTSTYSQQQHPGEHDWRTPNPSPWAAGSQQLTGTWLSSCLGRKHGKNVFNEMFLLCSAHGPAIWCVATDCTRIWALSAAEHAGTSMHMFMDASKQENAVLVKHGAQAPVSSSQCGG